MLTWLRTMASRIRGLVSRRGMDSDFDQELQTHLAMLAEENVRRGMTPEEARREAHLRLGGVTQIKETNRESRGLPQIDTFLQDIRYAARMLRKSPGFTLVAVLTLALGIGVNTTLFTAFDAVALKPLPVKDPGTVVRMERWFASGGLGNGQYFFSYPEYLNFRDHNRVLSSLVAVSWPIPTIAHMAPDGAPERLRGELVSDNYFSGMGVDAMLGRTFLAEENRTLGTHPVVVLSYPFWRVRCNADPLILGKTIRLHDTAFTVVGVTSQEFIGTGNPPQIPDFWVPLMMQSQLAPGQDWLNSLNSHFLKLFGRLQPGTGLKEAQAELMVIARQFGDSDAAPDKTVAITLEPATFFGETNNIQFKAFVVLLMFVVGMVLLIACANLANMLLARAAGRHREIGVRLALGASRSRVIRQLLTESVLLSMLGGAAGLLFSTWASRLLWIELQQALPSYLGGGVALVVSMSPDIRVFSYALIVSVVTGVVFGMAPALQCSRQKAVAFNSGFSRSRTRSFLLAGQVAVSMTLLISAGLLVRGLVRSQGVDPGFESRRTFRVGGDYGTDSVKALALQQRMVERLRSLPDVRGLTLVDRVAMAGTWTPPVRVGSVNKRTLANHVSPSYFETLGVPVLRGRTFTVRESETGATVAVISESAARLLWAGEDPIGKRAELDMDFRGKWVEFEVIGVAKDVRTANLSRVDPAYFYLPTGLKQLNNILIRTGDDTKNALAAVRASLEAMDKNLAPSIGIQNLEDSFVRQQRLLAEAYATFATMLAVLALALAGVGIYGVMSYLVSQRVREIGIRMALGANARDVVKSVVQQGLRPVFFGAVVGLVGAAGISSILKATLVFPGSSDMLFGVSVFDPVTFIGLTCFLGIVALLASAIPAMRATKVDPMVALRYE